MAIIAAQSVTLGVYWLSRFYADLEQQMNSSESQNPSAVIFRLRLIKSSPLPPLVERVKEYLHLPTEAPNSIPETTPPAYWPSSSGETLVRLILFEPVPP